jgi:hypothetical protein
VSARHHKIDRDPTKSFPPASADESFDRTLRWLAPLPAPDRRWRAALRLAAKPRSAKRRSANRVVAEAVEYLRAVANCATDGERAAAAEKWSAISQALAVFQANSLQRWELEARVLAGQTIAEIAIHCNLASGVVAAYRRLFFSVAKEYLDEPEWLARKMFRPRLLLTFRDNEVGRFWAWLGLTEGPVTLDAFVEAFHAVWKIDTPPTLSVYLRPDSQVPSAMAALVAVSVLPRNKDTIVAWFWFAFRVIEALRDPVGKEGKLDQVQRDSAAYALGFLSGKTARQLERLLHWPRRRKRSGAQSLSQPMPIDLSMLTSAFTWPPEEKSKQLMKQSEAPTAEEAEQLLETAAGQGRSVPCPAKREMKSSHIEMMDLLRLGGMLPSAASSGE